MSSDKHRSGKYQGIFTKIKALLERNRLGELMVQSGILTPKELKFALARQKTDGEHLGRVLLKENLVTRTELYKILSQQFSLRCLTAAATIVITFSSFGIKPARAGSMIRDVPSQLHLVSEANAAFGSVKYYPALFGAEEKRSRDITPFTKWTSMFERFDQDMSTQAGQNVMRQWKNDLAAFKGLPLENMVRKVNTLMNDTAYIIDSRNWGKSDYWATPYEFFTRGGDCEDFAIAKYASLRALGVPEERMRIAIVHDEIKDIPHAVLVVYTDSEALILDNQTDKVITSDSTDRYRPLFSINRTAWWLHTAPEDTKVASAAR